MIDSHCHLTDPRLHSQIDAVLQHAAALNVREMVTIATTPEDAVNARALAAKYRNVHYVAGFHPNETGPYTVANISRLREFASDSKCVALGEMGLDYHWKDVPVDHQRRMFEAQLDLAAELDKPVVIHCREAVADALAVMRAYPSVRAVYHCFTGSPEEADAILAAGHYLGFTGPLTFKKNEGLRLAAARAPRDKVLIETDSPYLAPEPHRSLRVNEPMYVRYVLETLAKVWGIPVAEADAVTTANTKRLYRM